MFHIPKVLFISGVFKHECQTDDMVEKKMIEEMTDVRQDKVYSKIPTQFISFDQWNHSTDICCWNCTLNFETSPVFIPKLITANPKGADLPYRMSTYGIFCSFSCAKYYIDTLNEGYVHRIEMKEKLSVLYQMLHKKKMRLNPINLSRYQLEKFGGDVSASEFRNRIMAIEDNMGDEVDINTS
jgi:hypothetical protein